MINQNIEKNHVFFSFSLFYLLFITFLVENDDNLDKKNSSMEDFDLNYQATCHKQAFDPAFCHLYELTTILWEKSYAWHIIRSRSYQCIHTVHVI